MSAQQAVSGLTVSRQGHAAIVTLDKPHTLNALDLDMLQGLTRLLEQWAADDAISAVVVRSSSPKAFCAGGDIRHLRTASMAQRFDEVETFFTAEYGLSGLIGAYPKPYVSLIDGYCMGGGMGISMHGGHRVVAEGAVMAMPETLIGFYPDVGSSYLFPRLNSGVGPYLALTGTYIGPAEALETGLATSFVPRASHTALVNALIDGQPAAEAIHQFSVPLPEPSALAPQIPDIASAFFKAASVLEIIQRLEHTPGPFASRTLATLRSRCPTSLALTFENMRRGARLDLPGALPLELHLCVPVSRRADYAEGVRAAVVDKDHNPRWQPARIEDVDMAAISALYEGAPG